MKQTRPAHSPTPTPTARRRAPRWARAVASAAFGPISRQVLRDVAALTIHADAPDRHDPPLPLMQYGDARRFPLWGVPSKNQPPGGTPGDEGT